MNNLSLYTITNKFAELMDRVENGELTQEEYNQLGTEIAQELQNKSANIIGYIRNSELLIEAMKTEEKRIADLRKIGENRISKFKDYVKENMDKLGVKEILTELGKLSIAKNPMSIEIENEDEIPAEFKEEITTIKIDKTKIKNHFKTTGEIVKGTRIVDNKTNLRVK